MLSRHRERGFSLLEALVATAIIGMAAIGVLEVFGAQLRAAVSAEHAATSTMLLEYRLAQLRLADVTPPLSLPDSIRTGRFEAPFEQWTWRSDLRAIQGRQGLFEAYAQVDGPMARDVRVRFFRTNSDVLLAHP